MKVVQELTEKGKPSVRYPGIPRALDGTDAVVEMETAASEAAGAYPITPSTQMGEGWAVAAAKGTPNVNGRPLLFFEPEGEHAAAGVTAGMAMVGLRSANFSSGQGIAYMHESLYPAVGKRLTYVLNMACRAMTKHALNVHAGHDDYHAIDDTGFFQLFAKNAQEAADLNLICHRIAEQSLNPGVCAQDGFLTSHVIESVLLPERELIKEYLGDPADVIDSPTPAQRMVFGDKRRRIPEMFDFDNPTMIGVVQNQDSYAQGVASQRPFFFDHITELTDQAMEEYAALTGRRYRRTTGYRTDDAEYLILGQGSVVFNAEAVVDDLRKKGISVGVVNVTMFRPFPSDLMVELLRGKKGVVVLERVDQPLAVDPPLLREVRVSMAKAVENNRSQNGTRPYPNLPRCQADEVPNFYAGCFGLGSRDLQPGDLIAAVENMLPDRAGKRHFYLGIEFVRDGKLSPKMEEWQKKIVEAYPNVTELALKPSENVNMLPESALAVRIHSVGGWGAITMGKNLTMTLFELLGMQVKSNPKYGSEKKGQPTTFYAVFAHEPVRVNCELKHVDVVLSPDPNVFRHSNPLAGLSPGGMFVMQHDGTAEALWNGLPGWAQRIIREKKIKVSYLDAFAIAKAETDVPDLQFRMQGAAFQGAFFKSSPIMDRERLNEEKLFDTIQRQLEKKFGHRGKKVVDDNFRVIRRGFEEVQDLEWEALADSSDAASKEASTEIPWRLREENDLGEGMADPFRFQEAVASLYETDEDPLADPFAAISAIPASTGVLRDMTGIRFEVPELIAEKCTGCGQCWTQCPDAAIPGLVTEVETVFRTVANFEANGGASARMKEMIPSLAKTSQNLLREEAEFTSFAGVATRAYAQVADGLELAEEERKNLDQEFDQVCERLTEFPFAKTAPFFIVPEKRETGSGGLLSVTINPYACKGCNLCVEVCPDQALVSIKQDESVVKKLKRNWQFWETLPDTPDRFEQIIDLDEGIGVLHTMLLKKKNFHSMVGGDGSCMGCGEKTGVHLIVAAIEAHLLPRVAAFVKKLDDLIAKLEAKSSGILMAAADLDQVAAAGEIHVDLKVNDEDRDRLARITALVRGLKDLRWRYVSGPSGRGRAATGISNSTGCSSVWGSTYPYNPYPYPWSNHLFQDAPSVAIGIFLGWMRKMADAFAAVRKAELELDDAYDPSVHDAFFRSFDWTGLTKDEFELCPPVLTVGGDGAMLDIGFQNVSRLMASGLPIRVVVLDTQVYSNTGGQACTSGYRGQISDMAAYGNAHHGKEEQRKEMGLIAMAHRNTFVLQSSQALPAHLLGGVLRGLNSRRPAIFNIYTPCQAEHGLPDSGSAHAAKLALESRAFPYMIYDPDAGPTTSDRLDLEGNPASEETWPMYELNYVDEEGREQVMTIPLTTADWAATEPRFGRHFSPLPRSESNDDIVPIHEYLDLSTEERVGKTPAISVLDGGKRLMRMRVSPEMVELCEDRLDLWNELRELAGTKVPDAVKSRLVSPSQREYEARIDALRREYEDKIAELKEQYPARITRRIAQALVNGELGGAVADLVGGPVSPVSPGFFSGSATAVMPAPVAQAAPEAPAAPAPEAVEAPPEEAPAPEVEPEESEGLDPYIDTELCTTCNDCTDLNPKMFVYNSDKKAYIKDPRAGTFKQLVQAAERCPAQIIHPGTPLDSSEPDLEKWIKRAERFN